MPSNIDFSQFDDPSNHQVFRLLALLRPSIWASCVSPLFFYTYCSALSPAKRSLYRSTCYIRVIMTLILAIKVRDGIVLAAESRRNLNRIEGNKATPAGYCDDAIKLLYFKNKNHRYVGALASGNAMIGGRLPNALFPELEATLPLERITIREYAQKLLDFFMARFNDERKSRGLGEFNANEELGPDPTTFYIAGFNKKESVGRVYSVMIPSDYDNLRDYSPQVKELMKENPFDIEWDGQREIIRRLYEGYSSYNECVIEDALKEIISPDINNGLTKRLLQTLTRTELHQDTGGWKSFEDLSLQEAVELAYFFMQTTIDAQKFMEGRAECGGTIRVCTITKDEGLKMCHRRCP